MSDCSAKASEPKKTCGNCIMYDEYKAQCDYFVMDGGKEVHEQHSPEDSACEDWEKTELYTEQRCQQLEQVARDMYAALHVNEHCSLEFIADKGDCETFRARLEALGGSVDG